MCIRDRYKVVRTHNRGICGRTLPEIERPVHSEKQIIVLVIAQRGEPGNKIFPLLAFQIEEGDLAAVGKIQLFFPESQSIERTVETARHLVNRPGG